jgi:uncharacterized protein (DUF1330 family)
VYAINWFNTNRLWLYNFYNLLASVSVKKVGGKAFFKGRVQEVLAGDDSLGREVLLIVHYPGTEQFIHMLENTYFKLVSMLRLLAVKQFSFGFTQRTDSGTETADCEQNKTYAIHHYRATEDLTSRLAEIIQEHHGEVCYAGRISALLYSGDQQQTKEQVPCLMNGLVLLRAESHEQIKKIIAHDRYQTISRQCDSSFVAILNRIL